MPEESIKSPTLDKNFAPKRSYIHNFKIVVKYVVDCLKQDKVFFTHGSVVNFITAFELNVWSHDLNADFKLKHCLFGIFKLTKNAYRDKYSYFPYDIEFDSGSLRSVPNFEWG